MIYRSPTVRLGRLVGLPGAASISDEDWRSTHTYVVGSSGTGKTKLLENICWQLILGEYPNGPGMLLLDPHGTLYEDLAKTLASLPAIKRPVLFVDPSRDDFVVPYNILRWRVDDRGRPGEPSVVARKVLNALTYVWGDDGSQHMPRFTRIAHNLLTTLYIKGQTAPDAYHYLHAFNRELMQRLTQDIEQPTVAAHWQMLGESRQREFLEQIESTLNRFEPLVANPRLARMLGQPDRSIDFRRALDEGWIILCNLSAIGDQFSDEDMHLLGTLFLADLWASAKSRGKASGADIDRQRPFHVVIDEIQNFVTPTIAKNLDQARGFGLRMTLAHQFPSQLTDDPRTKEHGQLLLKSILTNCRNKIVFGGIGHDDDLAPLAEVLYRGVLDIDEVKHTLYGTKVLGQCVEYEKAYAHGSVSTTGGARGTGASGSSGRGTSSGKVPTESFDADGNTIGTTYATPQMEQFNSQFGTSNFDSTNWAEADSESEMDVPMLKAVFGKEISTVQFRDLAEQRYRVMSTLFDQQQRQCVVRLLGMREPVSVFTPFVPDAIASIQTMDRYIAKSYQNWPELVMTPEEASRRLEERRNYIEHGMQQEELTDLQPDSFLAPPLQHDIMESAIHMTYPARTTKPIKLGEKNEVLITPRDLAILEELFTDRLLTVEQAGRLYWAHSKTSTKMADKRLRLLHTKAKVLSQTKQEDGGGATRTYYTFRHKDRHAFELLKEQGRLSLFDAKEWGTYRKRFQFGRQPKFEHDGGAVEIKSYLLPAINALEGRRVVQYAGYGEDYKFNLAKRSRSGRIKQIPDSFFTVQNEPATGAGKQFYYCYVEYERKSKHRGLDDLMEKAEGYFGHYRSGNFWRWATSEERSPSVAERKRYPFRALFVMESEPRIMNFFDRFPKSLRHVTMLWFTTLDQLKNNPLGEIWRVPRDFYDARRRPKVMRQQRLLYDEPALPAESSTGAEVPAVVELVNQ